MQNFVKVDDKACTDRNIPKPIFLGKSKGDANCDGTADLTDYFYFVQESNRIRIPPGVSADFNQDGKIDRADRDIIVDKVGTLAQSVIRFSQRILATISNFRI